MTSVQQWRATADGLDRLDCDVLLAHALGCNRAAILAHPERRLEQATVCRLDTWRDRRLGGEPLAYILQTKEFWGLEFTVTPDVLIPRPDTELLVEQALQLLRAGDRLLDLGAGSGAVGVAIGKTCADQRRPVRITASDIARAALGVAQSNAKRHRVPVSWMLSDWFSRIDDSFDIIVSNPPYVAENDPHLADLGAEPRPALVAGHDGLDAIRHIVANAREHLTAGGWLLLEHGYNQGPSVCGLLRDAGFVEVRSEQDLSRQPRVSLGRNPP